MYKHIPKNMLPLFGTTTTVADVVFCLSLTFCFTILLFILVLTFQMSFLSTCSIHISRGWNIECTAQATLHEITPKPLLPPVSAQGWCDFDSTLNRASSDSRLGQRARIRGRIVRCMFCFMDGPLVHKQKLPNVRFLEYSRQFNKCSRWCCRVVEGFKWS